MPGQARLGDRSLVPADTHGCPGCPHSCNGPAIIGSPDVLVNGRPAIRVSDHGMHGSCCQSSSWLAKQGSSTVMINNKAAHRLNDMVQHCGGIGATMEASMNVITGG